jgi:hypothetical protein
MPRRDWNQQYLFDYGDIEPWYPSEGDLRRPWAEVVDRYDEVHGTNVRAEFEAAGIPVIRFEGSVTQRMYQEWNRGDR